MVLVIWFILIIIGVSDVQKQRIPNKLIGLLLLAVILDLYLTQNILWSLHLKGFLLTFAVCFGLYLARVMAGGDVKLLAVVGLWLGAQVMWQATAYIIVAGGIIGAFYLLLHLASSIHSLGSELRAYAVQRATPGWKKQQALAIPFAPAVVIGVAYYFYLF